MGTRTTTLCLHISRGGTSHWQAPQSPPGLPDNGTQGSRRARAEGVRTRGDRESCPRARHLPVRRRPPRLCAGRMGGTPASPAYPRHASSCSSSCSGFTACPKRLCTCPSRPTRNLVKFHSMSPLVAPASSALLRKLYTGCVCGPFTSARSISDDAGSPCLPT